MPSDSMFNTLSENWQLVKKALGDQLVTEPDFEYGVVCPLCFHYFPTSDNISKEHVPPKSIGGEIKTITCKQCNSYAGYQLDNEWKKKAEFEAFWAGDNSGIMLSAEATVDNLRTVTVNFLRPQANRYLMIPPEGIRKINPASVKEFTTQMNIRGDKYSLRFSGWKERHSNLAIIRAAYLLAFSFLGYSFLMNPNLHTVRQQIQNPQETILSHVGVVTDDISDELLGINVIKYPVEARCFFVVFDVELDKHTIRYGVPLPGRTNPGLSIYDYFSLNREKPINLDCIKIDPFDFNEYPLKAIWIWDTVVNLPAQ